MIRVLGLLLLCLSMADASLKIRSSSRDGRHPTAMNVEVTLPDKAEKVQIPLTRTDEYESMPVTVMRDGVSRTFSARQLHHDSHAHYNNIESNSVMSVRDVDGHKQFTGHFMHNGRSYFVAATNNNTHNVTASPVTQQQLQQQQDEQLMEQRARSIVSRRRRQTNGAATTYVVEIAVCIDSTVYDAFRSMYGSNALTELHYYYTHIMNGVNVVFRNIRTVSVSVRSISLTISQSTATDRWMPAVGTAERTDGEAILKTISSYKASLRPQPDHVMAFTKLNIHGGGSLGVIGVAYLARTCSNLGVSINEDNGIHSWNVAAHELGHNMGSQHDGSGSNYCDPYVNNVMAPSTASYTVATVEKSYRFSTCSQNQIMQFIQSMGSSTCLKESVGRQVTELATQRPSSARLTLDQVCKLAVRTIGKFYASPTATSNPASICASISCFIDTSRISTLGGARAPAGTTCGSRKSCNWNGQCVEDSNAPVVDESCMLGDSSSQSQCDHYQAQLIQFGQQAQVSYCPQLKSQCCKTLASVCSKYW